MNKPEARAFINDVALGATERVAADLKRGVPVDVSDAEHGETALMIALTMDRSDIINLLLEAGSNVNARDARGRTPLMFASATAVSELISRGADLNARDNEGRSALIYAVLDADDATCAILVKARANVSITDNCDDTALTIAVSMGMISIQNILSASLKDCLPVESRPSPDPCIRYPLLEHVCRISDASTASLRVTASPREDRICFLLACVTCSGPGLTSTASTRLPLQAREVY